MRAVITVQVSRVVVFTDSHDFSPNTCLNIAALGPNVNHWSCLSIPQTLSTSLFFVFPQGSISYLVSFTRNSYLRGVHLSMKISQDTVHVEMEVTVSYLFALYEKNIENQASGDSRSMLALGDIRFP